MNNYDRMLQFINDCHHKEVESLPELPGQHHAFYRAIYGGEKLIYLAGGTSLMLFAFTLKGRFKYNQIVSLPYGASRRKDSTKRDSFGKID